MQSDSKRSAANYAGLDKTPRKRRKTKKKGLGKSTAQNAEHHEPLTPESSDAPNSSPDHEPGPNGEPSGDKPDCHCNAAHSSVFSVAIRPDLLTLEALHSHLSCFIFALQGTALVHVGNLGLSAHEEQTHRSYVQAW